MTVHWLTNKTRFCINENYETENEGRCYWGLPSISADDPTFPPLGYWRGYVWGPMAQLTYWSLAEYDHVPVVRSARKAMCKQMTAMFLNQWRLHAHICENFVRPAQLLRTVPGYGCHRLSSIAILYCIRIRIRIRPIRLLTDSV